MAITVTIRAVQSLSPPALKLLVKRGETPILWDWGVSGAVSDAEAQGDVTAQGNSVRGSAVGTFPAGKYVVMLANAGETVAPVDIRFGSVAATPPDAGMTDAGVVDPEKTGCDCRVGGRPRTGPLGALAWIYSLRTIASRGRRRKSSANA